MIELLIVMAIIAVLSALSLFTLQGSRENARDAKRKADLETIRQAVEIYRADCGSYPLNVTMGAVFSSNCTGSVITYLQQVPNDPVTTQSYDYVPVGAAAPYYKYVICTALEGETTSDTNCSAASCGGGTCSYSVGN